MIAPQTLLQNRYLVQKQIGQGGMGAVYLATDQRFGSTVALKETFFTDATLRKAFEREARLLNRLRHSALPNVSDHFTEGDGQFLVMEYIPGEDLSEMLEEQGGAFPVKEVLGWANQLLDALDYLHTQESPVIHRDIKPQNLKLTPRGQIILLDFGLAKGSPLQVSQVTASGSVFGYSRNYAPIEQIKGTGTDPRSDIYGLAATLYHLVTGVTPPDALTRASDLLNGQADPLVPANEVHSQVTHAVAQVLSKALSHNAGQRPQTAIAMREALNEAASQTLGSGQATNAQVTATSTLLEQDTQLIGSDVLGAQTPTESIQIKKATAVDFQPSLLVDADAVTKRVESAKSTGTENLKSEVTQLRHAGTPRRQLSVRTISIAGVFLVLLVVAVVFALTRQPEASLPKTTAPTESGNPPATTSQTEQQVDKQNSTSANPQPSASPASSVQNSAPPSRTSNASGTQELSKGIPAAAATPARTTRTNSNTSISNRNSTDKSLTEEQIEEERRRVRAEQRRAAAERQRALRERRRAEELRRRQLFPRP